MSYCFEEIGTFELTQPILRVSDPCYNKDVWCSLVLPNAKVGTWEAAVSYVDSDSWGHRVAALAVRHAHGPFFENFANPENLPVLGGYPKNNIHLNNSLAGVDSGQCGFFDDLFYGDDDVCKNMEITVDYGSPWYNMCCDTTLSEEKCGVVPYGAVSSSGVGDGAYGLYYMLKDGQVVAAMLQFMFPGE